MLQVFINVIDYKQCFFCDSSSEGNKLERELKSFVDIANEVSCENVSRSMDEYGLSFDKNYFVAKKEVCLSFKTNLILSRSYQILQ